MAGLDIISTWFIAMLTPFCEIHTWFSLFVVMCVVTWSTIYPYPVWFYWHHMIAKIFIITFISTKSFLTNSIVIVNWLTSLIFGLCVEQIDIEWGNLLVIFTYDEVTSGMHWQVTSRVIKNRYSRQRMYHAILYFEHTIPLKTIIDRSFCHCR